MNDTQFEQINKKLNDIVELLALNYVKELQYQKDKFLLLDSLGFSPTEIASICDTTQNNVSSSLSQYKN